MQALFDIQKKYKIGVTILRYEELAPIIGEAEARNAMLSVWLCGGAQTTFFTENIKRRAIEVAANDFLRREIEEEETGPRISILGSVLDLLSEESAKAILAHEYGHVVHNHITAEMVDANVGQVCDVKIELEADAFAASLVGKDCMRQAILDLGEVLVELIRKTSGMSEEDRRRGIEDQLRLNNSEFIQERLAALM